MSEYPYGKGPQRLMAKIAVDAGCKGNTMGVFFYLCAQKIDWVTGQTTEISHRTIGQEMGLAYHAVQRAITALIGAGVMKHEKKGVVWANGAGRANIYQFSLQPTPSPKQGRAPPQNREEPLPKTGNHYINPYIQKRGASAHKDAPRRGGGDKVSEERAGELRQFSRDHKAHGMDEARRLRDAREAKKHTG
ncbi:hypothetical protein JI58_02290 [Marinosulfonomonas sp. PRT-SC04]|nr:hypothetical protein JI58_07370 [Marinosulfonomonas sp. PRT-SC04]KPU84702.1 hypothetical protein JI58_02290 [Marinosulfonomonas sp. PRT-SC04]